LDEKGDGAGNNGEGEERDFFEKQSS
jgi:hypothetical protein